MKRILWFGLLILIIPAMVAFYGFGTGDMGNAYSRNAEVVSIAYPDGSEGTILGADLRVAKNYREGRLQQYAQDQGILLDTMTVSNMVDNQAIVDQAVNLNILRHYAESNDLTVSVDEVIAMIHRETTADQRRQIEAQWNAQGLATDKVLEDKRRGLELQKAAESIGADVRVTHYEAWQDYLNSNESIVADYVRFNPTDYMSSVTVTDAGLKAYFEKNQDDFRVPDQIQYEYVLVQKDDLKSTITLTDDQITSYYNENKEDFRLPRKVEARQIFLQLPSPEELNTTSAAALTSITQAVRAKADDLYERAAKGESFATLADTYSEEINFPTRANADTTTATDKLTTAGGYLGLLSEEVTDTWYGEQWTSAVFSMQPGSITRPIRTPNGFGIVQVQKIITGEIQPLDEVRPVIESRLRDAMVEPVFEALGERLNEIAERVTSLEQIAKETSRTLTTSPKVTREDQFIPGIGLLGELEESVKDLREGGRSDVLTDSQRHLIIQVKQEFPAHNPTLEEIRGRVEQTYKRHLAEETARKKAEAMLKKSTDFAAFQTALSDAKTTYIRSRPFTRPEVSSIFGGPVADFARETAGIREGDIKLSKAGRPGQQQTFVVWHVEKLGEPSKTDFARDLPQITQRLLNQKRDIIVLEYIRDQRARIKDNIEVDEKFLRNG